MHTYAFIKDFSHIMNQINDIIETECKQSIKTKLLIKEALQMHVETTNQKKSVHLLQELVFFYEPQVYNYIWSFYAPLIFFLSHSTQGRPERAATPTDPTKLIGFEGKL